MSKTVYLSEDTINLQKEYIKKAASLLAGRSLKAHIVTYGCQQNESDSEKLKGMAIEMGYELCDEKEDADLIVFNTCAVRENAELKVFGNLGQLKHLKKEKPELVIAVCGCMMQQDGMAETIRKKYRHVDLVFGTHALYMFPQLLAMVLGAGEKVFKVENSDGTIAEGLPVCYEKTFKASVSIMYGCNNFCSYCIVPYVRGRERSRKKEMILAEIKTLADNGCREVMLLGQNVNSYGKDLDEDCDFSDILEMVCKVDGIERVRFMTSHPKDLTDKLIETIKNNKKICRQLHLPFQSGSDRILGLMNRGYTKEKYLDLIRRVKQAVPDIALTTDVIVGFPGETREDFLHTLDVIKEVEYDMIFSFIYSPRKGTPAAEMEDTIPDEEKHRNFEEMLAVQDEISYKKNLKYADTIQQVLVEGVSKTDETNLSGRTDTGKLVNFRGDTSLIGSFVTVKITNVKTWSLEGEIV